MSKLTKVVFDESRWSTGMLTRKYGNHTSHCALGFYMNQLGIPDHMMEGKSGPDSFTSYKHLERFAAKGAEWLLCPSRDRSGTILGWELSEDAEEVMLVNDTVSHGAQRISRIREIFAKHGIEVEVVKK